MGTLATPHFFRSFASPHHRPIPFSSTTSLHFISLIMDSLTHESTASGASSSATTATANATSSSSPNSAQLMLALSQIQQLIPLLDYRPGGLTHLLPTLLTPLLPSSDAQAESMQRYRANVDHAFRVAAELVGRVEDGGSVGNALQLSERLMHEGDEKKRLLRVRKKRRLFVEQEKLLEVGSWGPAVPIRAAVVGKKDEAVESNVAEDAGQQSVEMTAFLPSQNPTNTRLTTKQQNLEPPTSPQALHSYLAALHSYLSVAVEKGLAPPTIPLKHVKARITAFSAESFTLEVQIARAVKACIEASVIYAPTQASDAKGESRTQQPPLNSVSLASLTVGAVNESIVSTPPLPSHLTRKTFLTNIRCSRFIPTENVRHRPHRAHIRSSVRCPPTSSAKRIAPWQLRRSEAR
ncbi:pH response protein PalF [Pseudozyma hubeiensis SY62]|uniref:pH response protein PalF n=1 Tax=Pseudozyma hubeiensis (strain SY62) TaxID=1305764 RepID=R9P8K0_PSEHS|nr:pH response protein PalF [Pseudozyma hubeiensis SY62]GAC97674.1 pH response protein PalF [Pseudozyma hubeiensis SY62]